MNESEWIDAVDHVKMIEHLQGLATDRKLRLFSVACCRSEWAIFDTLHHQVLERLEQYADEILGEIGIAVDPPIRFKTEHSPKTGECYDHTIAVISGQDPWKAARVAAVLLSRLYVNPGNRDSWRGRSRQGLALARDIFGNPFRTLEVEVTDQTAIAYARQAYSTRALPSGHLDGNLLRCLAGTLSVDSKGLEAIISHFRGPEPHVRGCWALDLVLGKS